jgi:hypothetical protein
MVIYIHRYICIYVSSLIRGAPKGGCQAAAPLPKPPKTNLKNTDFVDIAI